MTTRPRPEVAAAQAAANETLALAREQHEGRDRVSFAELRERILDDEAAYEDAIGAIHVLPECVHELRLEAVDLLLEVGDETSDRATSQKDELSRRIRNEARTVLLRRYLTVGVNLDKYVHARVVAFFAKSPSHCEFTQRDRSRLHEYLERQFDRAPQRDEATWARALVNARHFYFLTKHPIREVVALLYQLLDAEITRSSHPLMWSGWSSDIIGWCDARSELPFRLSRTPEDQRTLLAADLQRIYNLCGIVWANLGASDAVQQRHDAAAHILVKLACIMTQSLDTSDQIRARA